MNTLSWKSISRALFQKNKTTTFKVKLSFQTFFIAVLLVLTSRNSFATIPRGSEPSPPKACKVGNVLYTEYIRTVYSPSNSSTNINGYRYIFKGSGAKVTCVNSSTVFMGTDPNNSSANTAIGCDLDKTLYSQTSHNDSIANYVACPIDNQLLSLIFIIGTTGFLYVRKSKLSVAF